MREKGASFMSASRDSYRVSSRGSLRVTAALATSAPRVCARARDAMVLMWSNPLKSCCESTILMSFSRASERSDSYASKLLSSTSRAEA